MEPVIRKHFGKPPIKTYCGARTCRGRRNCKQCRNLYQQQNRHRWPLSEEAYQRANCRAYTKVLQARGLLPKGPCEGCGEPEAQNHHPDYDQPRYYIRLCKDCHEALEAVIRATSH